MGDADMVTNNGDEMTNPTAGRDAGEVDVFAIIRADAVREPDAGMAYSGAFLRQILAAYDALRAERDALADILERVKQQAAIWKQEARTQGRTVKEVGAVLGGVPDYGPIADMVAALRADAARVQAIIPVATDLIEDSRELGRGRSAVETDTLYELQRLIRAATAPTTGE